MCVYIVCMYMLLLHIYPVHSTHLPIVSLCMSSFAAPSIQELRVSSVNGRVVVLEWVLEYDGGSVITRLVTFLV